MDLEPNPDEQQTIDAASHFLRKSLPVHRLRGTDEGRFNPSLRAQLAELGWYGMGLSEEQGGFGLSVVDETLVFREIGRSLGPIAVLGISLAAKIAANAGRSELAASLIGGKLSVAIAVDDPNRETALLFEVEGADLAMRLQGGQAQLLSLKNATITALPCLDKSVSMGRADLGGLTCIAETAAAQIEIIGRLHAAAMLVGICEATTHMLAEYAKIRETFGRAIGSYQAVRHPCADMAVRGFASRAQLFLAAVSVRDDLPDAPMQVDAAKALANEAATLNVDSNIQLHGGIATTDEHDAHLYMKRANLLVRLFGSRSVLDSILLAAPAQH